MKNLKYALGACAAITALTVASYAAADHMSPWGEGFALDPLGNHSEAVERVDPGSDDSNMERTSVAGNEVSLQDFAGHRQIQSETHTQPGPNEDRNYKNNELEVTVSEEVDLRASSTMTSYKMGSSTEKLVDELDTGETMHLIFMREEEKLAHDVYVTLADYWRQEWDVTVFDNIIQSEMDHMAAIARKIDKYNIEDPSTTDEVGVYTGEDYGWYFSEKYTLLVQLGQQSHLDALYVGALIEEVDMYDIVECPEVIVEDYNDIDEGECGMEYTDENSIITTYSSLLEGSKDHLRAFVRNIEAIIGDGNYEAQFLEQWEVDEILNR